MQKAKKTMPSRTGIPPDAQAEILQKLSAETKITSCEIAEILKKHDVCGDMDALHCVRGIEMKVKDGAFFAVSQHLHAPVRQITDITGQSERLSFLSGRVAETDPLNPSADIAAQPQRFHETPRIHGVTDRVLAFCTACSRARIACSRASSA